MPETLQLRPAAPVLDEGRAYARFLDQAADGLFRFMLGGAFAEVIAQAYLEPGHDLSHRHAIFAVQEGRLLGMASGYTAAQHCQSSDGPLRSARGFPTVRAAAVFAFCAPLFRFMDRLDDDDFYLQAIAVGPELRGGGVGSRLLEATEARAREAGAGRLCLDVAVRNDRARRLYERIGMRRVASSPNLWLLPRSGVHRMAKRVAA